MIAALPMYLSAPEQSEALWSWLAQWLRDADVPSVPATLTWPSDYPAHWQHPDLLLSQACGYPLLELLDGRVQLLGTFHYRATGCDGPNYRSLLVARADDARSELADFRAARVAYNSTDSQSGYNTLRALVAPLARQGRFFADRVESGGHSRSLELIRAGAADLAAIDCVSLALLQRHQPDALAGIKIVGQSASAPALPLITSQATPATTVQQLRGALKAAMRAPALAEVREALLIEDFEALPWSAYDICRVMKAEALALGYPALR